MLAHGARDGEALAEAARERVAQSVRQRVLFAGACAELREVVDGTDLSVHDLPPPRAEDVDKRATSGHYTKRLFVWEAPCLPPLVACAPASPRAPTTACRRCSTRPRGSSREKGFPATVDARHRRRGRTCCPARSTTTSPPRKSCWSRCTPKACAGSRRRCAPRSRRTTIRGTRLEAACVAHLEALLEDSDYAQVVIRVRPDDAPAVAARLVAAARRATSACSRELDRRRCRCRRGTDRRSLRLHAAGRAQLVADLVPPGGDDSPRRSRAASCACCASRDARRVRSADGHPPAKCSSPRSASTATTAAAASSPRTCATPAWK